MKTTKRGFGSSRIVAIAFLGSMATALASAAAATNSDNFPRIGLLSTGGPQKYASSFQTYAAKFQVVIIGGNYEGWERGAGYSKEKVIQSIKSQSTVDTRVFQYVALNELYNTTYASLNPLAGWYNQVVARNWWLHPNTTAGTPVVDPQSSQKWLVNMGPERSGRSRDGAGAVRLGREVRGRSLPPGTTCRNFGGSLARWILPGQRSDRSLQRRGQLRQWRLDEDRLDPGA